MPSCETTGLVFTTPIPISCLIGRKFEDYVGNVYAGNCISQ